VYRDANVATGQLRTNPATGKGVIDSLSELGVAHPLLNYRDAWTASSPRFGDTAVPAALKQRVIVDRKPAQMIDTIDGEKVLVVGVPLADSGASYFEFSSLADVNATLRSVGYSLLFAGFITTLFGIVLGSVASRRAVKPLGDAAQAAKAIAG